MARAADPASLKAEPAPRRPPGSTPRWQHRAERAFSAARPASKNPNHALKELAMQYVEAHGCRIPTIGLGTMTLKEDVCVQAVKTALQIGYHHIDTANFYGNEKENGEGFRQSGVKRDDMFITTKVRENNLTPENFQRSLDQSLSNLQLPYVDLLLIHWNNKDIPFSVSIP
ncbi:MAG TPA: aldo/keto reductase, partial [Hyphomicrobium sp.]|nr:aldo/keto reductase [Hyphomicrobium sp.]